MIKVTIIGSGNVGSHLVNLFYKSKRLSLNEWYSRSLDYDPRVKVVNEIDKLSDSDIYIICVNDDSISIRSMSLNFTNSDLSKFIRNEFRISKYLFLGNLVFKIKELSFEVVEIN